LGLFDDPVIQGAGKKSGENCDDIRSQHLNVPWEVRQRGR
jgi:hypothetical protein